MFETSSFSCRVEERNVDTNDDNEDKRRHRFTSAESIHTRRNIQNAFFFSSRFMHGSETHARIRTQTRATRALQKPRLLLAFRGGAFSFFWNVLFSQC